MQAFEERAARYETGWLGKLHRDIVERSAAIALGCAPQARRALDVGCGTGQLLRLLADRLPGDAVLHGIDPAPAMVEAAKALAGPVRRPQFQVGVAEQLPFTGSTFDLVLSTTSFDHWEDQRAGLHECARVLRPGGCLVLADQFSAWLAPTLLAGRRGRARTKGRAGRLLEDAGFKALRWHSLGLVIVNAVSATR